MVNSINSTNINPIQMFNAVSAFKASSPVEESQIPETSDGTNINDSSLLQAQDLSEIKEFAKKVGEENLSNDDIQYGLTYGRSVIADYVI